MRALGAACIFLFALILCRSIGEREERRIRESEEVLALVRAIKAGITCARLPLGEIYRAYCSPALTESGFLATLTESGDLALAAKEGELPDAIRARLSALSASLGRSDREREGELCDYYIAELERELATVRREGAVRQKSGRVTVVTGALMLVLLLL